MSGGKRKTRLMKSRQSFNDPSAKVTGCLVVASPHCCQTGASQVVAEPLFRGCALPANGRKKSILPFERAVVWNASFQGSERKREFRECRTEGHGRALYSAWLRSAVGPAPNAACAELSVTLHHGGGAVPCGGPSDVVARIVIDHMGRTLGHLLVIENISTRAARLSARVAASAPPD